MAEYRIQVKDKSGNKIGEFTDWTSLSFNKALNYYGQCQFTVPINQYGLDYLTGLRKYEVDILRNNAVVWSGEQVARTGGLKYGSANLVTFTCYDYLEMLNYMYTEQSQVYTQVDAGAIAWDLIDTFQQKTGGDLGFTQGTIEATKLRDRKYYSENIMELIIRLTEVLEGFDFEITNDKVFNVYYRKGIDRSNTTVLQYGVNIREVKKISSDFTAPCNQAIILGEQIDEIQERTETTDNSSVNTYGLRQGMDTAYNVTEEETLTDKGGEMVRRKKNPILTLELTQMTGTQPEFGSILVGDTIRVMIDESIYQINSKFRVYGIDVKVSQNNDEVIEYLISSLV